MTLLNDDVLSITAQQTLLGEEVLNIFYYKWSELDAGALLLDVLLEFEDPMWVFVRLGQNPDVVTSNFIARNLTNGIDIEILNSGALGLDSTGGDVSPSYVAAGYALNVGTLETRPGSKRIAGTSEQRVNDNAYDAGGTITDDIETAFASTLTVVGAAVGEGSAIPHVVGRNELGELDLTRTQPILSCQVSALIRSQVSRREG